MKNFLFLALALPLFAEEPKAVPIEDGETTTLSFGLKFDVPEGWSVKKGDGDGYVLAPDGANASGVLEEAYLFVSKSMPDSAPDSDAVKKELKTVRDQLLPGAKLKGDPDKGTFGDFEGLIYCYEGKAQDGATARMWAHVFVRGDHVCALVALGFPKALKKRQKDVVAILGSMRKSKKPKSSIRAELVGQWIWFSNFTANNGGGRQTTTSLTLNGDGTFRYDYEHASDNPFGAAWGNEKAAGTWTATETSITFTVGGNSRTCTLEKRNHPKNVNDPMIVVDGKSFVTATRKEPWK